MKTADSETDQPGANDPTLAETQDEAPMLDVHPPHEPIHGVRDFLLHIATITIGLLIALGLEAGVEAVHHRHLVREAREQIGAEIGANQKLIAKDRRNLDANNATLRHDVMLLSRLKDHSGPVNASEFRLPWGWSSPSAAAWQTAHDDGALALMPYDDAHGLALVYGQQVIVNDQATLYINHHHAAEAPLTITPDITGLTPMQLDEMIRGLETTLSDMQYLEELMASLDHNYSSAFHDLFPQ